jgi:hypothetical protein
MAEYRTQPNAGVTHGWYWWSNHWSAIPIGVQEFYYDRLDETMSAKNTTDYIYGNSAPVKRDAILFVHPGGAPDGLDQAQMWFYIYVRGNKVLTDPGLRFVIYYEKTNVPSAASGTNNINVYTTDGSLANVSNAAHVINYTRNATDRVLWDDPGDPNHVLLQFGITGQTAGDHIEFVNYQAARSFDVNTGNLWKSFLCKVNLPGIPTKDQVDDTLVMLLTTVDGGDPPIDIG